MLFSSVSFLFVFLPVVIGLYFFVNKGLRNYVLLIASIIFYALGNLKYVYLLLLIVLINYFGAIIIQKSKNLTEKFRWCGKLSLALFIALNVGILFYFKYTNFFLECSDKIFRTNFGFFDILLPVGISFYTFQAMSYIIDVYRGECSLQKNLFKLALYICLFPQLVAGPIIKYHDIENQLTERETDFDNISLGAKRFVSGLAKKILIADTLGVIVDKIFTQSPDSFSHLTAWLGSLAYTFQIYYDFSGYSDMAIGLGLIFGFKFLENFNYPFVSKSITEFWRRWHISLSTWFKQYVYIPLGGNKLGKFRTSFNLMFVFALTGFWHGANWTFIVWGLWNGIFIVLEKLLNIKEYEQKPHSKFTEWFRQICCFLICTVGFVFFRSENLSYAVKYLKNMFGLLTPDTSKIMYEMAFYIQSYEIIIIVFAIICSFPVFRNIFSQKNILVHSAVNIWLLVLFFLSVSTLMVSSYNPFVYFRF